MLTHAATPTPFDDPATPLAEVTFVVLDLETTGTAPQLDAITEIGAVKYRGGERLGTFDTLVNPGVAIPPFITVLTGITEAMVLPAPRIDEILPALLEFIGAAVLVGHNFRFDTSFLDAALLRHGASRLDNPRVDTLRLSRRLVRDEVPDLKLATLAHHLRVSVEPCHRALADADATAEVFHALLERAGTLGVLALDDLLAVPTLRAHPTTNKLRLTARLPRRPGVYTFRDRNGRVLYVGRAQDLRTRVRSHFRGDHRRKVPQLLREAEAVDWVECTDSLEAAVREARLIRFHQPRFNGLGKGWRAYAYLKLTLGERFPRLAVVRSVRDDGAFYFGPLRSTASANRLRAAIESALPIRRCTTRLGRRSDGRRAGSCPAPPELTRCACEGGASETEYRLVVDAVLHALRDEPDALVEPLTRRMHELVDADRFEEAADTRDLVTTIAATLRRHRMIAWLLASPRTRILTATGIVELEHGRLHVGDDPDGTAQAGPSPTLARDLLDEMLVVAGWVEREITSGRARVLDPDGLPPGCVGALPS